MRKVTQQAAAAFNANRNFGSSNTTVSAEDGETKMYLHGNLIARKKNGALFISNAGWQTNVTKERLNGISGVNIQQKDFTWYLNGKEWGGEWFNVTEGRAESTEDDRVFINVTEEGEGVIVPYTGIIAIHSEPTVALAENWCRENGYVVDNIID